MEQANRTQGERTFALVQHQCHHCSTTSVPTRAHVLNVACCPFGETPPPNSGQHMSTKCV